MPVDQAAVQKLYDAHARTACRQPEKRTLVEIRHPRRAPRPRPIVARAEGRPGPGRGRQDLRRQADHPTPTSRKTAIADPAVADAAFATQAGQVIGPIQSDLAGYAVVKVDQDHARRACRRSTPLQAQLEAEVKTDAAIQKVYRPGQEVRATPTTAAPASPTRPRRPA